MQGGTARPAPSGQPGSPHPGHPGPHPVRRWPHTVHRTPAVRLAPQYTASANGIAAARSFPIACRVPAMSAICCREYRDPIPVSCPQIVVARSAVAYAARMPDIHTLPGYRRCRDDPLARAWQAPHSLTKYAPWGTPDNRRHIPLPTRGLRARGHTWTSSRGCVTLNAEGPPHARRKTDDEGSEDGVAGRPAVGRRGDPPGAPVPPSSGGRGREAGRDPVRRGPAERLVRRDPRGRGRGRRGTGRSGR